MIVRCRASQATGAPRVRTRPQDFHLTPGELYLVLGLTVPGGSSDGRITAMNLLIEGDDGHVVQPLFILFEIVDPHPSCQCEVQLESDGSLNLWPPSFHSRYYPR